MFSPFWLAFFKFERRGKRFLFFCFPFFFLLFVVFIVMLVFFAFCLPFVLMSTKNSAAYGKQCRVAYFSHSSG